jgi:hypothetical protein
MIDLEKVINAKASNAKGTLFSNMSNVISGSRRITAKANVGSFRVCIAKSNSYTYIVIIFIIYSQPTLLPTMRRFSIQTTKEISYSAHKFIQNDSILNPIILQVGSLLVDPLDSIRSTVKE